MELIHRMTLNNEKRTKKTRRKAKEMKQSKIKQ